MTLLIEPSLAYIVVPDNPSSGPEVVSVVIDNNPVRQPPTYTTDPYTGEKQQLSPGAVMPRGNVIITLKNRLFTPYIDKDGNTIGLYYIFFWKYAPDNIDWTSSKMPPYAVYQSDSADTVVTFSYGVEGILPIRTEHFESGAAIDFRVQVVTGYFKQQGSWPNYFGEQIYEGEGSAFTEFTVAIPSSDKPGTSKPTIQPTTTIPPTINSPDNSQNLQYPSLMAIIFSAGIIAVLLGFIVYLLKQRKTILFNDEITLSEVKRGDLATKTA